LLYIFGAIYLVGTPVPLVVAYHLPQDRGGGITIARLAGVAGMAICGFLLIAAGRMCWRRRWVNMFVCIAVFILTSFVANRLLADLHL
jgi:hypothetical protein